MSTRIETYLRDALLGGGLAVLDHRLAYRLASHRWPTNRDCATDFSAAAAMLPQMARDAAGHIFHAWFDPHGEPALVAARSANKLEERIEWVTGERVFRLVEVADVETPRVTPHGFVEPQPPTGPTETLPAHECERRRVMLEGQPIPAHDCHRRRQAVKAGLIEE